MFNLLLDMGMQLQLRGVAARRMLRWSRTVGISETSLIQHFDKLVGVGKSGKPQISLWPSLSSVPI